MIIFQCSPRAQLPLCLGWVRSSFFHPAFVYPLSYYSQRQGCRICLGLQLHTVSDLLFIALLSTEILAEVVKLTMLTPVGHVEIKIYYYNLWDSVQRTYLPSFNVLIFPTICPIGSNIFTYWSPDLFKTPPSTLIISRTQTRPSEHGNWNH